MRCRIWLCEWVGREEDWLEHRAADHPTAHRVAGELEKREGREPLAAVPTPGPKPSPSPTPTVEAGSRPSHHCVYCGAAVRRGDVCVGHSDLPGLEPIEDLVVAA